MTRTSAEDYGIAVFYDGEKTEDDYFRGWQLILPRGRLTFSPVFIKSGGNALTAVKKTKAALKNYQGFAEYWCVCDLDDTAEDDLSRAEEMAAANSIRLCISRRCFEVWLQAHYEYSTASFTNRAEAIRAIAKHVPAYSKKNKTVPFIDLLDRHDQAITNAQRLVAEGVLDHTPAVFHLARKLGQNL